MKYVFPICSLLRAKVYTYKSTDRGNRVGPCLSLLPLFDSLFIRQTLW